MNPEERERLAALGLEIICELPPISQMTREDVVRIFGADATNRAAKDLFRLALESYRRAQSESERSED